MHAQRLSIGAHWWRLENWCTLVKIGLFVYLFICLLSPPPAAASLKLCDPVSPINPVEPHPLRPYPGKDCTPDIEQKARLTCGTDLVAVKKVELDRGGSGCSDPDPDTGTVSCTVDVTINNIPIAIGLSDLELPIAGIRPLYQ